MTFQDKPRIGYGWIGWVLLLIVVICVPWFTGVAYWLGVL